MDLVARHRDRRLIITLSGSKNARRRAPRGGEAEALRHVERAHRNNPHNPPAVHLVLHAIAYHA